MWHDCWLSFESIVTCLVWIAIGCIFKQANLIVLTLLLLTAEVLLCKCFKSWVISQTKHWNEYSVSEVQLKSADNVFYEDLQALWMLCWDLFLWMISWAPFSLGICSHVLTNFSTLHPHLLMLNIATKQASYKLLVMVVNGKWNMIEI